MTGNPDKRSSLGKTTAIQIGLAFVIAALASSLYFKKKADSPELEYNFSKIEDREWVNVISSETERSGLRYAMPFFPKQKRMGSESYLDVLLEPGKSPKITQTDVDCEGNFIHTKFPPAPKSENLYRFPPFSSWWGRELKPEQKAIFCDHDWAQERAALKKAIESGEIPFPAAP